MATILNSEIITYNPAAVLNIFNNALTIEATKKAFRIRAIYLPGKGVNYSGSYYDSLKDESSDSCVTLIVPAVMRHLLIPQQTIEFTGYLTKKVQQNVGKIELHINLIELLSQKESEYSEEQIKVFEVL